MPELKTRTPVGILYLIGSFHFGGSERHLLEVVKRLDRSRFRPMIGVLHRRGELESAFEATGVPIHTVGIHRLLSLGAIRRLRELDTFARLHGARIVHGMLFHGNLYGALVSSRRSGRLLITSERGVFDDLPAYQQWGRRFYHRRSRRMLVNSEAVRRYVQEIPSHKNGWLEVVRNGVDTDHFNPAAVRAPDRGSLRLPSDGVVVGHVGRFREEKGQEFMLRAFRAVADRCPRAGFLVVGGGREEKKISAEAARPPLAGRTVVLGFQADVRPLLRMMDIFVLPSRTEGMPNALLEAMSMGVACVATRVGGTNDLLGGGAVGKLVDYGDVAGLTQGLVELIGDRDQRRRLGLQARRRAVERFSMDSMIRAYERIYEEELRLAL